MVAARRGGARGEESEGSAEDDDDDDWLLSASDSGSTELEDDGAYEADSPDCNGPGTRRPLSSPTFDNAPEDISDPQQGSDDSVIDPVVACQEDVDMEDEGDVRDDELFDVD
ncbi:hypothetical protein BC567DRAFT_225473 [Phyllosticta citribraziliensis]